MTSHGLLEFIVIGHCTVGYNINGYKFLGLKNIESMAKGNMWLINSLVQYSYAQLLITLIGVDGINAHCNYNAVALP